MQDGYRKVQHEVFGRNFEIETGVVAKQASGAVLARYGDTVVIATIVAVKKKREGEDFLPLTVNYQEKTFAAGRIPGGYFRREGRPTEKEVLTSRLIDRPIRPLFPKNYFYDTQIIITVLSADGENDPDVLALTAASASIMLSDVSFGGPIAAVRVGRVEGEFVCNPTTTQRETSDIDIIVAGTAEAIVMVEGSAEEVSESDMVEALMFAHESLQQFIEPQLELISGMDIPKREIEEIEIDPEMVKEVRDFVESKFKSAMTIVTKIERSDSFSEAQTEAKEHFTEKYPEDLDTVSKIMDEFKKELVRGDIVANGHRLDARGTTDIRAITGSIGLLPRTHGSALFTRGETQAIVVATLGTKYDEQRMEGLNGDFVKTFMLHYNFPPFSVGETSFRLGPGRREIGHGHLAEVAIEKVLPTKEEFPYTIRIVSDILESNGSSSMATVCGASLSLMDAGVPIKAAVSGIAMGLIKEGDDFVILSDILGDEDHLGDMDFKVAGTANGITALQMDIKVTGVTKEILSKALDQANVGRMHILEKMNEMIAQPREDLSDYAPRIISFKIKQDKIKDVIGPGGKVIKGIIEATGVSIDINDDGVINIATTDPEASKKARAMVEEIIQEAEIGKIYFGVVKRILDFGAFVEIFKGTDGLVHISELEHHRVKAVTDVLKEGDELLVKCLNVDRDGKIRLSRKEALNENIEDYRKTNS